MFNPYHKVWRLIWKNNFLEKISNEKSYIAKCLKEKNLLESYNEFAKLHGENFNSFDELFYTWAERYFPEYFDEAINYLKKDIPNSDYFLYGTSKEMMVYVNLLFKKVKDMDGEPLILELLMSNLQITDVLEYYKSLNQDEYEYVISVLKKLYDKFSNVTRLSTGGYIKCLIFCERFIKKNPTTIWEDFLKMLFLLEHKIGNIVDILDPVRASIIRQEKEDIDNKIKELIFSVDINISNPIELKKFRIQSDYADYFNKNGQPKYLEVKNTYILRNYQVELIMYAIRGQNCILMAPTGSGKTLCAVEIMRSHMFDKSIKGEGYRCLFLAPTGPLVLQQFQVLKNYLGDLYTVTTLSKSSSDDEDVLSKILAHDVIVCTPQLFLNNLLYNDQSKQLYFSDLSLIIFDECHHCNSSHQYKQIMNLFHRAEGNFSKPQIVGLTASIGTGKTVTYEGCYDYYLEMAINLDAKRICAVYKNRDTLIKVMKLPVDEIIEVDVNLNILWENLNNTIQIIIDNLLEIDPTSSLNEHLKDFPISDVTKPGYFSKISKLATFKAFIKNPELSQWIDNAVKAFIHIHLVKEVSQLLPISYVDVYCQKYLEDIDSVMKASVSRDIICKHLTNMRNAINDTITNNDNSISKCTPIFEKLLIVCREQIKKLSNSRIIIFVPTRFIAVALYHSIELANKAKNLDMRSGYIIANGNSKIIKQSIADQKVTLEQFRKGTINIIIATTIAEEGLDISECNLVVKYNVGGNEKTLIQRRGRARAQNAKSILLTCNNTYTMAEITNIQKEKIMTEIAQTINCMSHSAFTKELEKKKIDMKKKADEKYENEIERKKQLYGKVYNVCCRQCKNILTKSTTIRKFNTQHIVLDEHIFEKIFIDTQRMANPGLYFSVVADGNCKVCNSNDVELTNKVKLGEIINIDDHFYFKIILRNISFISNVNGDTYEERSKWDAVGNTLFLVPNVSIGELTDYNSNLQKSSKGKYSEFMECKEKLRIQNTNLAIWKKIEEKETKQLEKWID
uniref:RNA helicase n=1 Tax=Strongyloides stercoralis TaxID=6248 RepID=A0A0K0ER19_STRER